MATTITLVSRAADGTPGNADQFFTNLPPVFSPDGKKVAFVSSAPNLVPGDTNLKHDIFVKDLATGAITLVSRASDGTIGNGDSDSPVFSSDGTKLLFSSASSNLVAGDTNAASDIFVKDLNTGAITLVSRASGGALGNGASSAPSFSSDGTKVVFRSSADNFAADDTNGATDVFVKDLATGAIVTVSRAADGSVKNGGTNPFPVFSPDGTKVAFDSNVSFVPDTNGITQIFIKDLATGAIDFISRAADGTFGNSASFSPVYSADGTKVAFYSNATNLVPGDTNNHLDIFVKDLGTGAITLVSRAADGTIGNDDSRYPEFSADGTKIAFSSLASNLVPGDTNVSYDIFVKDLNSGAITLISRAGDGTIGNGNSLTQSFSPDGTKIVFQSSSSDFASGTVSNNVYVVSNNPASTIITGTSASETLTGTAATDVIYGLDGNDTLVGGAAALGEYNQLWGGNGSDTASYAATAADVTADLRGGGYIGGTLVDSYDSIENLTGGSGNDTLIGTDASNILAGGTGSDVLYALGGDDVLIGGTASPGGTNQLWGGLGNDTASYVGTAGAVYADLAAQAGYVGGVLVDQMNSIENLIGGSGTNTLVGDGGANVLTGGVGSDALYGQGGNDILIGGKASPGGTNQLWGGLGSDTASYVGTAGAVYADLSAQAGYVGGVLTDQMNSIENLTGGSGNDVLVGDIGANVLTGGAGADQLYGMGGADQFVYTGYSDSNVVTGYDTIADFVSGTDTLDLTALHTSASHIAIASGGGSSSLYVEQTAGIFNAATDLAISVHGAITTGDIQF